MHVHTSVFYIIYLNCFILVHCIIQNPLKFFLKFVAYSPVLWCFGHYLLRSIARSQELIKCQFYQITTFFLEMFQNLRRYYYYEAVEKRQLIALELTFL